MEPVFISGFCIVLSRWESLTPPGQDINLSQFSSQQTLVLIYHTPEGWKSELAWAAKKVTQIFKSPSESGSNWGTFCRKAQILQLRQSCPPGHTNSQTLFAFISVESCDAIVVIKNIFLAMTIVSAMAAVCSLAGSIIACVGTCCAKTQVSPFFFYKAVFPWNGKVLHIWYVACTQINIWAKW